MATSTELTLSAETLTFNTDTSAEQQITVTTNATDFTVESNPKELTVTKETNLIKVSPVKGKVGTFNITVKAQAEQESDSNVPAEVSKTIQVTITELTKEKPSAPVRVDETPLEVDEGLEIQIPFNEIEGATLNATSDKGTPTVEGFIVKFNSPLVDTDEDIIIKVTATKDGLVSDETQVTVKVKNIPEAEVLPEVEGTVDPISLTGEEGSFQDLTVTTDTDTIEVTSENQGIASGKLKNKTIKVSLTKEGNTNIVITLKKDRHTDKVIKVPVRVTKQGEVIPPKPEAPIELPYEDLFIQIDKNEVSGNVNDKFRIEISTNAKDFTVESDDKSIATFDKSTKEVTLLKAGVAYLTFKVDENGLTRQVPLCCICKGTKPIITVLFNGVEYKFDNEEEMNKFFEEVRKTNYPDQ